MKVGFVGAGNVTRTIGRHLITAGHTIVVSNSRGPATLADFVADLQNALLWLPQLSTEGNCVPLRPAGKVDSPRTEVHGE
jgi:8-hydroxy-5-deazaflavin:NADPH oxidoreductase